MPGLRSFLPFAILPALIVSCAHAPSSRSTDPAEVRAAIEAANGRFAEALVRGDATALAAFFTDDGEVIYPTVKTIIAGKAAIEAYWAARFQTVRFSGAIITTTTVQVEGDLAYETGTNKISWKVADGSTATRPARYLVVWKRGSDGQWRIRVDAVVPDPAG